MTTIASRRATIAPMVCIPPSSFSTHFNARTVSSIYLPLGGHRPGGALPVGQPRRDSGPDQLRPAGVARVGGVVAVGRDELRPQRNFAPAGRVEIPQLRAVGPARALQRLVEGDRLPADRLLVLAAAEARRHR